MVVEWVNKRTRAVLRSKRQGQLGRNYNVETENVQYVIDTNFKLSTSTGYWMSSALTWQVKSQGHQIA